ncbi:protein of unknown function [Aminobacter niigataensis]|nr:protein of unknown function [Aminobacter niigataensis]
MQLLIFDRLGCPEAVLFLFEELFPRSRVLSVGRTIQFEVRYTIPFSLRLHTLVSSKTSYGQPISLQYAINPP